MKIVLVTLITLLALTGCNVGGDDPGNGAVDAGNGDVARIVVVDGVRCVVVNGYRSTAVSCDWSK